MGNQYWKDDFKRNREGLGPFQKALEAVSGRIFEI